MADILLAHPPPNWSLQKIDPRIEFYAVTRGSRTEKVFTATLHTTDDFKVNLGSKIVFVTHGFGSGIKAAPWMTTMKNKLLEVNPEHVVALVDWSKGAVFSPLLLNVTENYKQAVANCLKVGRWLGLWVGNYLLNRNVEDPFIWGIGHSLGAHLTGMAGNVVDEIKEPKEIQGLDPAGPGFEAGLEGYRRICPTDARMVDIIHTDGFRAVRPHYGTLLPLGTIDFYPEDGYGYTTNSIWNHQLAIELFIISIGNPNLFETDRIYQNHPTVFSHRGVTATFPCKKTKEAKFRARMGYYADQFQMSETESCYHLSLNGLKEHLQLPGFQDAKDFLGKVLVGAMIGIPLHQLDLRWV